MTTKIGICCEIAEAYSYLLLQLGINAATVINSKHEWSIIKLDGKYYHIDPTFGLSDWDNLAFFMMNDEQRIYTALYNDNKFQYVAYYDPEVAPDFTASDDTYKPLWDYHMTYFDPTEKKIECWVDEKRIVNLLTEGKELGLRPGSPAEIKRYGIVCTAYRATGAIKSIKMRKIVPGDKPAEKN